MVFSIYDNFKGFASSRPPLVVFMICLGIFALTLLSFAYYVKSNQVANPDISQDWNLFLKHFSQLEFCIMGNGSESDFTSAKPDVSHSTRAQKISETTTISSVHNEELRNYSVSMLLTIHPTPEFLSIPHNITHISTNLLGRQLGMTGAAANEWVNVTADLSHDWNNTHCGLHGCEAVQIYTCVYFQGSPIVFPSSLSPPVCEGLNETGINYWTHMMAHKPQMQSVLPTYYCHSRPVIRIQYKFNPMLTVWLSMHDRSMIHLHLMNTSYFCFVMVISLCCYAILRGRSMRKASPAHSGEDKVGLMQKA